jgi:broad specificity phosphatase PhoE
MRLYLFRHGEVDRSDLFFGQYDNPLNEQGERQSDAIARYVGELDIAAVYTSDLGRAAEAGRRISKAVGLPFSQEARLREVHLGWAEGLTHEQAFERDPELREARIEWLVERPLTEGGETVADVAERVRALRDELTERHRGRKVVVVSHNAPMRVIVADALGLPVEKMFSFRLDFGSLSIVEYGETKTRVALLNADPAAYRPGTIR